MVPNALTGTVNAAYLADMETVSLFKILGIFLF
jgi:hypothetical protein